MILQAIYMLYLYQSKVINNLLLLFGGMFLSFCIFIHFRPYSIVFGTSLSFLFSILNIHLLNIKTTASKYLVDITGSKKILKHITLAKK